MAWPALGAEHESSQSNIRARWIYHVMNRGDRREAIYRDEQDRRCFMYTLAEAYGNTGRQVHARCLVSNHSLRCPGQRWPGLRADRLLEEYRVLQDSTAGRRVLEQSLERRRAAEAGGGL